MKKKYFAETDSKKRSFSNLTEAVNWVKNILIEAGYSGISMTVDSDPLDSPEGIGSDWEFMEFSAVKDGGLRSAAIIENLAA